MRPVLYPSNTTKFDNNGIGVLSDAESCLVTQELNGRYELTMKYPITGIHYAEIMRRCILLAKVDPVSELQPFRIYSLSKPSNGTITVKARHVVYDLAGIPVEPFTAHSAPGALSGLQSHAVIECPFTFSTDKNTSANFCVAVPTAIWSQMGGVSGSVLDVYGGEFEYDQFHVKLLNRRGENRGVSIRYGKNLTSLQQDENCSGCYTGVMPYWVDHVSGAVTMLPEKIIAAAGTYDHTKIYPLDVTQMTASESSGTDTILQQPTMDQIRMLANKYMTANKIGEPTVSWTIQFVQLEQTEEYKGKALLERILLGDTVTVEFPAMQVSASSRAVAYTYNTIMERYESITLGSVRANLANTIVKQEQAIEQAPTKTDLKIAQEAATDWLTNGKGYKVERLDVDGNVVDTLYMDTPDINTAINVLRIGQSGIGFSHSGVNGPYLSAWTIDGHFNADFITAGTLYGLLFKAGVIQSADGKITIDLGSNSGMPVFNTGISTNGLNIRADEVGASSLLSIGLEELADGRKFISTKAMNTQGGKIFSLMETFVNNEGIPGESNGVVIRLRSADQADTKIVDLVATDSSSYAMFGQKVIVGVRKDRKGVLNGIDIINDRSISWKDNGDGTFTLIGR